MPRPKKGEHTPTAAMPKWGSELVERFDELTDKVAYLEKEVAELQEVRAELRKQRTGPSIHKVESFNGDVVPEKTEEREWGTLAEKVQCMKNAAKILSPSFIVDGRHLRHNIEAICPFPVTEDMMDELYKDFSHEPV